MDIPGRGSLPERNPRTHAEYKRQVFWQITLPLLLGLLLGLAAIGAIVFSAVQPVTDVARWADVSIIWIILPSLFIVFLFLVILVALAYAVSLLIKVIPRSARILQLYFELGRDKVAQLADLVVQPVIKIQGFQAALRRIRHLGRPPTE